MKDYYTRNTCRFCESHDLASVMHFPSTPIGDEYITKSELSKKQEVYPLDLVFCNTCGFLQIPNVVSPELLYRNYIYETNSSLNLAEHFQTYANSIIDQIKLDDGSTVFEIGCNDGTLLSCFKNREMNTIGIEPATKISKKAQQKGLTIVNDFFSSSLSDSLASQYGKADLICANNVLANVDDLKDFFSGIKALLKDNGTFIFESGYMIDLINNDVIDNIYHEHLSYFSVNPLLKNLKSHGLELFHVEHVSTKGGSMRYFIQKINGKSKVLSSVHEISQQEIKMGFDKKERFIALSDKHESEKQKLVSFLKDLKAQGKKIAGYGASVGVTTLLYYYDVADYIEFLADDNVSRHGLYSPGFNIEVSPSSRIYDEKIDYILCFPWRYIKPISEKNSTFLDNGGQFILPLPEFKLVGSNG